MRPPLVSVQDAGHRFASGVQALQAATLELAEGEFVSLLGPSGCGKSTLLRLVAGLATPSQGEVRRDETLAPAGSIGLVFQDATLLPWADVRRNVALPLELIGRPRHEIRTRVDEALELVALTEFVAAHPHQLSGGMRMRVSLARALAQKPRLLLLDEPFAALDEITRLKLNDDLLRLYRHEGWTVLFVTHSVTEAAFLSERVLVMTPRPGRIASERRSPFGPDRPPSLRTSPAFVDEIRELSEALAQVLAA